MLGLDLKDIKLLDIILVKGNGIFVSIKMEKRIKVKINVWLFFF